MNSYHNPRVAHARDSWLVHRSGCGECQKGTNEIPMRFCVNGQRLFNNVLAVVDPPKRPIESSLR